MSDKIEIPEDPIVWINMIGSWIRSAQFDEDAALVALDRAKTAVVAQEERIAQLTEQLATAQEMGMLAQVPRKLHLSGDSSNNEPRLQVTASMVPTGNAVSQGFGEYVKFDDLQRYSIMPVLKADEGGVKYAAFEYVKNPSGMCVFYGEAHSRIAKAEAERKEWMTKAADGLRLLGETVFQRYAALRENATLTAQLAEAQEQNILLASDRNAWREQAEKQEQK